VVTRVVLRIPALHCDGCVSSVAQLLEEFPGVESVEGNFTAKEMTVEYDLASITPAAMSAHLAAFGYPVESAQS
jgi:copper chaperone CopZ